jgi:predicted  nucleic acid-binding Zn-ribbon protein
MMVNSTLAILSKWGEGAINPPLALCFKVLYLASVYRRPNVSNMSDERADLILEHLRAIRSDISDLKTSMVEVKERLGFLEAQYASISRRVDRIDGRLERIERRLDLVEA